MNTTKMPGFTAEASLYRIGVHYSLASVREQITSGIVPALPSCAACDEACDKCWDCRESGSKRCPTCGLCNYCSGRSCSGGDPLPCCEVVLDPNAGFNCEWCGPH